MLTTLLPLPVFASGTEDWWQPFSVLDTGDTAWVMISAVLVLFMAIPGLALFYGGMVRKKNLLSTMMHSFSAAALVSVLWVVAGYSLAFTPGNMLIGGLDRLFLNGMSMDLTRETVTVAPNAASIPETVFMLFQMTFAVISTCIITGAFAERIKYSAMMLFSGLWVMLVYVPAAHWVWGGGFMSEGGVFDYAGGTVVHITAGVSGLVSAIVLGRRVGYGKEAMPPHNMAFTLTGAAMLWVGWFGFNAGSAVGANASAGMAMAVTQISAAAGALTWLVCEKLTKYRPSALGIASGAVAGLVGITPAAGFTDPKGALIIGILTAVCCYISSVIIKHRIGYDDSLDAFGIHGFGGLVGAILTGIVFNNQIFGGNATIGSQLLIQLKDALTIVVYSGIASFLILKLVALICGGLRVEYDVEREGLDLNIHGERVE
ncbi:ammonium transporter [Neisseria montereyensis]|uniref:Ammonium transporter n=1 Tax=Neisseria montereyensis TaxID=2973938 RepID=A0ABT2FDM9_9NEIS|nr:ammonium transporter [Neisseria montereyensis]MCS4534050.1 ammonium transporter [Neisseria montereyensis]